MTSKQKTCTKCFKSKKLDTNNFVWRGKRKVWEPACKKCIKQYKKVYYKKNKKKLDLISKQYAETYNDKVVENKRKYQKSLKGQLKAQKYYEDNKSTILHKQKEYYDKNKEFIIKKNTIRDKNRQKIDPAYKLRKRCSSSIANALKAKGGIKGGSILDFLPYSMNELKKHLELQFESWMNWDNWGKYNPSMWVDDDSSTWTWQLDHIIPHSLFHYTSMSDRDFKDCWALNNLRPYSSKLNIIDGGSGKRHIENLTTIITDLDGTLIKHHGDICYQHLTPVEVLPGVKDKIREWIKKRFTIIIVTGRLESTRGHTEKQLANAGIIYNKLIMNVNSGVRVLINDLKPNNNRNTAAAVNVIRNKGLEDVEI